MLQEDPVARQRLKNANTTLLHQYSPRCTESGGNCFYRAVSLALYGTQQWHAYLRLITCMELVLRAPYYDPSASSFVLQNIPVMSPAYRPLLRHTLRNGAYAELIHLFALSSALDIPIQSYCCPDTDSAHHPYTMRIHGDKSSPSFTADSLTVMWTASIASVAEPDHFVVLVPRRWSTGIPSLATDSAAVPMEDDVQPMDEQSTADDDTGAVCVIIFNFLHNYIQQTDVRLRYITLHVHDRVKKKPLVTTVTLEAYRALNVEHIVYSG